MKWPPFRVQDDDESISVVLANEVSKLVEGLAVSIPEPLSVLTMDDLRRMVAEIERLRPRPPRLVLLVAPERADGVRTALAGRIAAERDVCMSRALEAIEVRGDDDGVFVRDPDEGWVFPKVVLDEKVRIW